MRGKSKKIIILSSIIFILLSLVIFFKTSNRFNKSLDNGVMLDWSKAKDIQKKEFLVKFIETQFTQNGTEISEERKQKYTQLISDCLNNLSLQITKDNSLNNEFDKEDISSKKIDDVASLCILGIILKEKFN